MICPFETKQGPMDLKYMILSNLSIFSPSSYEEIHTHHHSFFDERSQAIENPFVDKGEWHVD
jgi:hypothetical protein